METKHLEGKGIADYDSKNDLLFFKVKDRDYVKSIETDNFVVDIDSEDFIVGVQIFEAATFLNLKKEALIKITKWHLEASIHENRIEVRLLFEVKIRNKIIEKNPIIMQTIQEGLPNSELICVTA